LQLGKKAATPEKATFPTAKVEFQWVTEKGAILRVVFKLSRLLDLVSSQVP